jgi:MFS transporter, DHA3 family, macrolide efflux protein
MEEFINSDEMMIDRKDPEGILAEEFIHTKQNAMFASKEKSNLILFSAGKLVSLLGTTIYSFAMSLYILKVTGSGSSFAFSILIGTLPRVLLGPIAGSLSDRADRKKMIVTLDMLSGVIVLALFILSSIYGLKIPFIYLTTFLLAVVNTFFNTCFSAIIPRLVTDKNLVRINSYSRAIDSFSSILGPIFAGMIFGLISIKLFLLINGLSFILSAISELFIDYNLNSMPDNLPTDSMSLKAVGKDIKDILAFIRKDALLSLMIPFSMSFNFLFSASLSVVLPFQINTILGMTSYQYGIIEGAFSVGMLIAAIVIGKLPEKKRKKRGLVIGIIGVGISFIAMGIPGIELLKHFPIHVLFILYIIFALLLSYFILSVDLPITVFVQRSIPEYIFGRVMGLLVTLSSGLAPIGIILAGITLDRIPAYIIYFISGAYFVAAGIIINHSKKMKYY